MTDLSPALESEIKRQLQIGTLTTAGAIAGAVVASKFDTNKTISIAAGSFIGLVAGVYLGFIDKRD